MILTPVFAPDAKSQWLELDIDLQERLLDVMERLATAPPGISDLWKNWEIRNLPIWRSHEGEKLNNKLRAVRLFLG